jgi:type I restriction enzyme S subunit
MRPYPQLKIDEFCETGSGGTPNRSNKDYYGGSIPWIKSGELREDVITDTEEKITQRAIKESSAKIVPSGAILLAMYGATVGRMAFLGIDAATNQAVCNIRPDPKRACPRYVFHFLQTQIHHFLSRAAGGAQPNISQGIIRETRVPLPPLKEQRRIAAILDKADALCRQRKRAADLFDTLTPSIFLEMFGRKIEDSPVSIKSNISNLPRGWQWRRLTEVARLATGHTPDRKEPNYWNGGIPWLSLSDIRALDGKTALATKECVTEDGIKNSSSVLLPQGTVCFSRTASVGFVTVMGRPMGTSQDFVNWVCGPSLNSVYLLWALIVARKELLSLASGSTHRTIYFPTVEQFHVLVPPIALQERFALLAQSILDRRGKYDAAALSALFSSLQSRAFSGRL